MSPTKLKVNYIKELTEEEIKEAQLIQVPEKAEVENAGTSGGGLKGLLELIGRFVVVGGDFV